MTHRAQHGFTLVEVLVALVLMAIVSLVSWQGLDSVLRVRDHVERDAALDLAALNAIGQLTTDVRMRAANHVIEATLTDTATARRPVLPLATRVDGRGRTAVLEVVRQPAAGQPGWQSVRWWREQHRLMRATAPAGQDLPLPAPGPGLAVLDDVVGFDIQAYIPGQGWRAAPWPSTRPSAHPSRRRWRGWWCHQRHGCWWRGRCGRHGRGVSRAHPSVWLQCRSCGCGAWRWCARTRLPPARQQGHAHSHWVPPQGGWRACGSDHGHPWAHARQHDGTLVQPPATKGAGAQP